MNFSHDGSWQNLKDILDAKLPIVDSWNKIIDFHEAIKSKPYWDILRQLNVEGEQKDIVRWMETILIESPMPKSIVALWIGITRIWDEESDNEFYAIYLRGADNYDAEDIDWADEPRYDPENNHGIVEVLCRIDELIEEDEDFEFLDWILPLSYCALTLDEIIRTKQLDMNLFSRVKNGLYVTTGFDEGDHIDLSRIE